jgi:hypothetical protein
MNPMDRNKSAAMMLAMAASLGYVRRSPYSAAKEWRTLEESAARIESAALKRRRKNAWRLELVLRGGFA